jgi:hypothetical protein
VAGGVQLFLGVAAPGVVSRRDFRAARTRRKVVQGVRQLDPRCGEVHTCLLCDSCDTGRLLCEPGIEGIIAGAEELKRECGRFSFLAHVWAVTGDRSCASLAIGGR